MSLAYDDAVDAIYAAATVPDLWPDALQAIADVFDDVGTLLVYQREDATFGHIWSPRLEPVVLEFAQSYRGPDLRAVRGLERGKYFERNMLVDADLVSDDEMQTHPYYQLLARHGLRHSAAGIICPHPSIATSLAIQRSIHKDPFTPEEVATFERLSHHAESSLRLSIRLLNAEMARDGYEDAFNRLGIGVLTLSDARTVGFRNGVADRLLGDGLEVGRDGRLRANGSKEAELSAAISRAVSQDPMSEIADPRPIMIERAHAVRPLTVYVMPIRSSSGSRAGNFLTFVRAIVLLIDSDSSEPADPALVRDILGVTLGEAKVASLIGIGLSPRDAAEKLGIAEETARTCLKRVFNKTGISRQSELVAMLSRLILH